MVAPGECKATDDLGGIQAIIKEDPRVPRALALAAVYRSNDPNPNRLTFRCSVSLVIIGLLLQA